MSVVLTRSPLEVIGMNGSASQKRRSARLSGEGSGNGKERGESEPPAKKAKINGTNATTTTLSVSTKQQDGAQGKAGPRKKRKEYTDEADDFKFARKGGKRKTDSTKAETRPPSDEVRMQNDSSAKAQPHSSEQLLEDAQPKTAQKKSRRRLPTTPEPEEKEQPVRRSKRLSDEPNLQLQPQPSPQRPSHAKSHANVERSPNPARGRPVTVSKKQKTTADGGDEVMRIMLPFADTPVQRRNKEMRKGSGEGSRRSSAGMRGKRASSMIDEGRGNEVSGPSSSAKHQLPEFGKPNRAQDFYPSPDSDPTSSHVQRRACEPIQGKSADKKLSNTAVPHAEVSSSEFYKHISADLTEPRRMRCLLGWCGKRNLPSKPTPPNKSTPTTNLEFQALQAARVIQDELSQDLVNNGMLSDWFSRDESAPPELPLRKKPNPRNIANNSKAEELERELERLKAERAEWDDLIISASSVNTQPDREIEDGSLSPVHPEHLGSPQRAIFEQLEPPADSLTSDSAYIQERLARISNDIEFAVDQFAHGIHALKTTRETAERVAEKSLADAATALEERERSRSSVKVVGQMDALRGLARVLNAQQRR